MKFQQSRKQLFEELDQPALRPLPERPYEFATWKNAKVNIDYHVAFEGHYYSVPHPLVRQEVRIRATESMQSSFHHGQQVAIHPRSLAQRRFSTRPEHMPANHRFVLTANGDWFQREARKIGPLTAAYISALLKSRRYPQHAYRSCLGIPSLARKYPHTQMETACQTLLEAALLSYRDAITIQNAQDILDMLDDRFGHTSTLISSQVPVTDWHLRIPDPTLADAILDRIVHSAHRIQLKGESQRKLRAQRNMPHT